MWKHLHCVWNQIPAKLTNKTPTALLQTGDSRQTQTPPNPAVGTIIASFSFLPTTRAAAVKTWFKFFRIAWTAHSPSQAWRTLAFSSCRLLIKPIRTLHTHSIFFKVFLGFGFRLDYTVKPVLFSCHPAVYPTDLSSIVCVHLFYLELIVFSVLS
jgi:hypothetical protein